MNTRPKFPQSIGRVRPVRLEAPARARAASLNERFFSKVNKDGTNGCWIWTACLSEKGYGLFHDGTKKYRATHYLLKLSGMEVPAGMMVCHHCDVKSCVNPSHIYIGTAADNNRDILLRGRMKKLTIQQAREIVASDASVPSKVLAVKYGVSVHTIRRIRSGTSWSIVREGNV